MGDFLRKAIDIIFYGKIDYNKKIKDFYCHRDKMVTPSLNPRYGSSKRYVSNKKKKELIMLFVNVK